MEKLITILLLTLTFNAHAELSSYVTGCAAGGATRDQPIEIWEPVETDLNDDDENKANLEFIQGYYDCRNHPEIFKRIEKERLYNLTSSDITRN